MIATATAKTAVLEAVDRMPDDSSLEDILYLLTFRAEIDAALKELDEGKGIPHEEVVARMAKWLT